MQKYLNKLQSIENKIAVDNSEEVKILTYCFLQNKKIKARLGIGINELQEPIYFNSVSELEKYEQEQGVTFVIEGFDEDKI